MQNEDRRGRDLSVMKKSVLSNMDNKTLSEEKKRLKAWWRERIDPCSNTTGVQITRSG